MTFEADAAGAAVGRAILESGAADRRVLVDQFTRFVISDRFVRSPAYWLDAGFRAEVKATSAMFRGLVQDGAGVRLTNPMGPLLSAFPFRNHKKLIVADDVAYIGGINFSDHNFEWWDLMLRIEDKAIADRLAEDFNDTYESRARSWSAQFGDMRLYGFDGRNNHAGFDEIIGHIDRASASICIISPYLTFPFVEALERAARRGLSVQLITPLPNNKPTVRDYLVRAAIRAGFDLRLTRAMIHLKGMLLDDRTLVLGSSNFDFVSYHAEEEFVAVVTDPALAEDFRRRVIDPALEDALPAGAHQPAAWAGVRSNAALRLVEWLIGLRQAPRGASDWRY